MSSSSSSRPLYIPPNKRNHNNNKKRQRFHGAFQGGFSAGYFNTVDTKEGWKPSSAGKISRGGGQSQRLEDFMDEQDHEEWGGPKSIKQDFNTGADTIVGSKSQNRTSTTSNYLGNRNNHNETDQTGIQTRPTSSSTSSSVLPPPPLLHNIGSSSSAAATSSLFHVTHQTVGPRLLRYLGWRESHNDNSKKGTTTTTHTAFVPVADDGDADADNNNTAEEHDKATKIILSKKKLKQIKLQSTKINKLPPPKLDLCGLGFDAHENAPEFLQYKLRRQKLAQQRAEGNFVANNVYRTSRLLNNNNNITIDSDNIDDHNNNNANLQTKNNDYLSYETMEDFVGTKSVSGFALRDDDDDAYDDDDNDHDNNKNRNQLLANITKSDEYNTEVYEHQDSDDDDNHHHDEHEHTNHNNTTTATAKKPSSSSSKGSSSRLETDFGGALASWAGMAATTKTSKIDIADSTSKSKSSMFTSDGRPPLDGFVLGGSLQSHKKRYPGPDIPHSYTLQKHKFKENEHPRIFQTLAHAVQIQQQHHHQELSLQSSKAIHAYHTTNATSLPPPPPPPHAPRQRTMMMNTQQFAGLAAAMKNRFTSSTTSTNDDDTGSASGLQQQQQHQKSGLHKPKPGESSKKGIPTFELPPPSAASTSADAPVKNITISRTVHTFIPHPLVCKRFGVPVPKHVSVASTSSTPNGEKSPSDHNTSKEAKFFENEVLPIRNKAAAAAAQKTKQKEEEGKESSSTNKNHGILQNQQDDNVDGDDSELPPVSAVERPPMDKLQSIFEPDSAEESSEPDTDLDSLNDDEDGGGDNNDDNATSTQIQVADKSSGHVANSNTTSSALVVIDASKNESKLKEKKNPSDHVHNDDDDSSSQNSSDHSLRKRHKRKRRKHGRKERHSSSRKMEKKSKKRKHDKHRQVRKDDNVDGEEDGRSVSSDDVSMSDSLPYDKEERGRRRRRKRSRSPSSLQDDESSSPSKSNDDRRKRKERHRRRKKHKGRRKKSDRKC